MPKNKKKEPHYEVEKIVGKRKGNKIVEYKVHWKGYSTAEETWEPESNLACPELIDEFENKKEKTSETPVVSPEKKKNVVPVSSTRSRRRGVVDTSKSVNSNRISEELEKELPEEPAVLEIEKIVTHEVRELHGIFQILYQVKFKGKSRAYNLWKTVKDLEDCKDVYADYIKLHERAITKAEQDVKKNNEAKNKENQNKGNESPTHTRKRRRTDEQNVQDLSEEENKGPESPSKRRRRISSGNATQNIEKLTPDQMASIKNFKWEDFHQAFCNGYNNDPAQRLDLFWKTYIQTL